MTDADDRDLLAAEYVLGTLDEAERRSVDTRIASDHVLLDAVAAWEARLAPLSEATREVDPPETVLTALLSRLFGRRDLDTSPGVADLRRRLRAWRAIAGACALAAACLMGWIAVDAVRDPHPERRVRFSAVLQRDAASPAMILDVDLAARRLTIQPIGTDEPTGKSYQLWIIDPTIGPPQSLGVVSASADFRTSLTAYDPVVITHATYAVTLEPRGGSPNGKPSGTLVLSGRLVSTSP